MSLFLNNNNPAGITLVVIAIMIIQTFWIEYLELKMFACKICSKCDKYQGLTDFFNNN